MNEPIQKSIQDPQTHGPFSGLRHLVVVRLKEFIRRPEAVFWVYVFPLLMVVVLGFAFQNKPVEEYRIDVQLSENASLRNRLETASKTDPRITLRFLDEATCRKRLKTGKSDLYLRQGQGSEAVEYVFDPTRPGSVVAKEAIDDLLQEAAGRKDVISKSDVEFDEQGGRYIDWLIPGLLGMGLMGGGLWGVGFAIVDMRIRKLLKRFLATPMRRTHYLFAIMVSRLLFMVPEMVLLVVFARIFFEVQIFGSLVDLILLILIGSVQFSGIGLLIAARCRTMESVSGLMNLTMLPMWTLSGIFFSYERFPAAVHPLIQLLPLTPLIDSLRAVMIEGTSILELWPQLLVMMAWSVISFTIGLWIFRWGD